MKPQTRRPGPDNVAGRAAAAAELASHLSEILDLEDRRFATAERSPDALETGAGAGGRSEALNGGRRVVLAVSGGADSLALMLAATELRRRRADAPHFHVVTVDHRLRDAAEAEAQYVEACARRFDLAVETCRWTDGPPITGNLAAAARNARYALLMDAAERYGASLILTGHHEDDQIETHLMAASRRAGPFGLAAMRPLTELSPRLRLGRPFLAVPGYRLKACVAGAGLSAVDDPTNHDPKSERVRLRLAMRSGEISRCEHHAALALHAGARMRGEAELAHAMSRLEASGALRFEDDSTVLLSRHQLQSLDHEDAFHLLRRLLTAVGGAESAPGGEATTRLLDRLRAEQAGGFVATLGGARLAADPHGAADASIVLCREYGRHGPPGVEIATSAHERVFFDRRFDVTLPQRPLPQRPLPQGARLVPFGVFGRGRAAERTMPVLASCDAILAAPARLARHVAPGTPQLGLDSRVRWRTMADLIGADGVSLATGRVILKTRFTV